MYERVGQLTNKVVEKLLDTPEGDELFFEVNGEPPKIQITGNSSFAGEYSTPAAFSYPNDLLVALAAFDTSATNPAFDENPKVEGAYAVAIIHELLHRKQSVQDGLQDFFEGSLSPEQHMHAELLIEAENYARTAQVAWRIANDPDAPYAELKDFMLSANSNKYTESSYAIYAENMQDKEINPENELAAMKAVVQDFLFTSHNAQRYASNRVTQIHAYLSSGKLHDKFGSMALPDVRDWMREQPHIRGIGPDREPYDPNAVMALGLEEGGSIFEIAEGFTDKIANPNSIAVFLNDSERTKLGEVLGIVTDIRQQFPQETASTSFKIK